MYRRIVFALGAACAMAAPVEAYELWQEGDSHLNADVTAVFGALRSRHRYDEGQGSASWREGFVKYGLSGQRGQAGDGTFYGSFALVSSATWGRGDPAGMSDGSERKTSVEEAFVGWRSGNLVPTLGTNGIEFSAGRQVVQIGRGFLVEDDGLNSGNALGGGGLGRGGAYYLGARHAFANTVVLRLGGEQGLHGSAMWLKSNNRAQAKTEMAAATLDYTLEAGTLGLSWIHGLDVDVRYASPEQNLRKGMHIYSLRGEGNAGIEGAELAFEYAHQQKKNAGTETAWYVQAGWQWAAAPWAPKLSVRHTRYGKRWDPFFTGGYLSWIQGEVAGNYAGPFNSNMRSHHLGLSAQPAETVTLGAMLFDFHTLRERDVLNFDGRELDVYMEWAVHDHLIVAPLVGIYKPKAWQGNGGIQSAKGRNMYGQILFIVPF